MKNPKTDDPENIFEKNETKKPQYNHRDNRRQVHTIVILAVIQVIVWLVLSLVACTVNYVIDLKLFNALIEMIIGMKPVVFEPVSILVPLSTNTVAILFLIQLRDANKRLDNIMKILYGLV